MPAGRTLSSQPTETTNILFRDSPQTTSSTRQKLYAIVDAEAGHLHQSALTVGEFILMIGEAADQARKKWADRGGEEGGHAESLLEVRRIAALAIRCMMQHSSPERPQEHVPVEPEAPAQGGGSDWRS
jgi:hypothetical protein